MTDASQTEKRLAAIGLSLPPREGPAYDYDPFKRDGATVYLAGTLGKENGAVRLLLPTVRKASSMNASARFLRRMMVNESR